MGGFVLYVARLMRPLRVPLALLALVGGLLVAHHADTPTTASAPVAAAVAVEPEPLAPRPRRSLPPVASRSRSTPVPKVTHRPVRRHKTTRLPAASSMGLNWAALRQCENGGSYRSKPGDYYRGAYQFDYRTWRGVGGSGDPAAASPAEQDRRAYLLYKQRGRSPWPVCGKYL